MKSGGLGRGFDMETAQADVFNLCDASFWTLAMPNVESRSDCWPAHVPCLDGDAFTSCTD